MPGRPAPWKEVDIPSPPPRMCRQRKNLLARLEVVQAAKSDDDDGKKFHSMADNMRNSDNNVTDLSVAECKINILTSLVKLVFSGDITTPLCCPDTGVRLQFFEKAPRGHRVNKENVSPDRFCEKDGYEQHNICWRTYAANEAHVPKLEGLRTCTCGKCRGVTEPNKEFILAALALYPTSDVEYDSAPEDDDDEEEEEEEEAPAEPSDRGLTARPSRSKKPLVRLEDGTYRQPPGRMPKGKVWDGETGKWVDEE
jgi:hypothetical protein